MIALALSLLLAPAGLSGEGFPDDMPDAARQATADAPDEPDATEQATPSAPDPTPEAPRDYALVGGQSQLYALLYKKGIASAVAHDHVVEARKVTGRAALDRDDPTASSIEVAVSVSGLTPDDEAMREKVGLPTNVSERQRSEILEHIFSETQLFLEKYDTIRFRSTRFEPTDDGYDVTGDFTLRGVTKRVTVPMTVEPEGEGLRARGRFRILQSDYGYAPYRALLGAIQNEDHVDIVIDAFLAPR